jgi:hypothetical protein
MYEFFILSLFLKQSILSYLPSVYLVVGIVSHLKIALKKSLGRCAWVPCK